MKHLLIALALFALFFATGCNPGTPAAVTAAQVEQERSLVAFKEAALAALYNSCDQLEAGAMNQINLILDYELRLVGDTIPLAKVQELLTLARAKQAEVKAKTDEIRAQIAELGVSADQVLTLQRTVSQWLASQKDETVKLREFLENWKGGSK